MGFTNLNKTFYVDLYYHKNLFNKKYLFILNINTCNMIENVNLY